MSNKVQSKMNFYLGDAARATKFAITGITDPFDTNSEHYLIIKTAQFPGKFHDVIDFKYKGRNIPIKGQIRYDNTWTCTFYLEESHKLRFMFMDWIEALEQKHNMSKGLTDTVWNGRTKLAQNGYASTITLVQFNFDDETQHTATYQLHNACPKSVSSVELDYSNVGTVLEYTVEFSFSHFEYSDGSEIMGGIINGIKNKIINKLQNIVSSVKNNVTSALGSAISSAKSNFSSSFNSDNVSGSTFGAIGSAASGFGSSLANSGSIFKGIDFDPSSFVK